VEPLLEAVHRHAAVGRSFPHRPRNHVDRHGGRRSERLALVGC
jgi:hypothetical protein